MLLGIYLSNEEVFYEHIEHAEDPITAPGPYGPNVCDYCEEMYAEETRQAELVASSEIAKYLPKLKTISWKSFFAEPQDEAMDDEQLTTMTIERGVGELIVKLCK